MICAICGEPLVGNWMSEFQTLVDYSSPPGHNHDDNCRQREYACKNGHVVYVQLRASCPACDWKGKKTCFCHKGEKVEEWP